MCYLLKQISNLKATLILKMHPKSFRKRFNEKKSIYLSFSFLYYAKGFQLVENYSDLK